MKVLLCVIYNHNYEDNIKKIDNIYSERFDNIVQLMPFYSGGNENLSTVINIVESSHNYEGYIAQAMSQVYSDEYDYYIFIADDLILNPVINQNNIVDICGCDSETAYIKRMDLLTIEKKLEYIGKTNKFFL